MTKRHVIVHMGTAPTYVPRSERLLGQALDAFVAFVPLMIAVILDSFGTASGTFSYAAMWLGLGYFLFSDGLPGGQSVAKRWLGMRVISESTGMPCSFAQSFVRNFFLAFFGPIDWLFIFGPKHQRLGDIVAGTIVVQVD